MTGELERRGFAVFAISYDPVDAIRDFAEKNGITFTFLSDEGSRAIEAVGVLDHHLEQHHAVFGGLTQEHQRGVAYPMTFVLDREGRVVRKLVEANYRIRDSGPMFLARVLGEHPVVRGESVGTAAEVIAAEVSVDTSAYRPYQRIGLAVRLTVAAGWHVYGPQVPAGYTPLALRLESAPGGVTTEEIAWPSTRPFEVEGLAERFEGYEGVVELLVPLIFTVARDAGTVRLELRIAYQACSDTECMPPSTLGLSLEVPQAPPVPT